MPRTKKVSVARSAANQVDEISVTRFRKIQIIILVTLKIQVKPLDRLDPESRKKFETICEDFDRQCKRKNSNSHLSDITRPRICRIFNSDNTK